jgi:hypothetical protein
VKLRKPSRRLKPHLAERERMRQIRIRSARRQTEMFLRELSGRNREEFHGGCC